MRTFIIMSALMLAVLPLVAVGQGTLIAHYPLQSDGNDVTGQMEPMKLINTPFQGGGIYSNGMYIGSGDPDYAYAETPILPLTLFRGFTISVEFMVEETITAPVIVGGPRWRWVGYEVWSDGSVTLLYNGRRRNFQDEQVAENVWHEARLSYDSSTTMLGIYLDGALVGEQELDEGFIHGGDASERTFSNTHSGSGMTFKGYLRNLKIWLKDMPTAVTHSNAGLPEHMTLAPNYPNPVTGGTTVQFTLPRPGQAELNIYNALGEHVTTLRSGYFEAGQHHAYWDAAGHPSGVYFYSLRMGTQTQTKALLLER